MVFSVWAPGARLGSLQTGSLHRCHVRPAPQQVVKERCALRHDDRRRWKATKSEVKNRKGPEPCGARASAKSAWKGMRLRAPSTRWTTILIMAMCAHISRQTRQQAQNGTRCDPRGTHERAARCGSAAGEGGGGVHGQILVEGQWGEKSCGRNRDGINCKESLLCSQQLCRKIFMDLRFALSQDRRLPLRRAWSHRAEDPMSKRPTADSGQ